MAENAQASATPAPANTAGMRGEIARSGRSSLPGIAAPKSKDDLVTGVQSGISWTESRPERRRRLC
jgi:hypothetical protein